MASTQVPYSTVVLLHSFKSVFLKNEKFLLILNNFFQLIEYLLIKI